MLIAVIRSRLMERDDTSLDNTIEGGFFELQVRLDEEKLRSNMIEPKTLIKTAVAQHLAQCVKKTGVPLGEGLWTVTFTEKVKRRTNLKDFRA